MHQYLELMETIIKTGEHKKNRTGIDTISKFGLQARYDLKAGFPLLTTKKVFFKGIIHELLWFISGDTNIKYLVDNKVNIWNEWAYERFCHGQNFQGETLAEFIEKIRQDSEFAKANGDLGPVYGKQWRNFNGVDQFANLLQEIKTNPNSRRLIVSAWNPEEIQAMALPPCHTFFQFYLSEQNTVLNVQLYQRSADMFLGVPFNIASYALLLELVAQECGLKAGELVHTIGDGHIYVNHLEQVKLQMSREPLALPKLKIKPFESIFDVKFADIELEGYQSHAPIRGEVAV